MRNLLSPKDLADAIGVSESSIRRWADGGQLVIQRTNGGHRKISLSEAMRFIRETQQTVIRPDRLGFPAVEASHAARGQGDGADLLHALIEGRSQTVSGMLFGMYLNGRSVAEICDGPLHHALVAIGNMWPKEPRSVFLEHRATMLCMRSLNQLRLTLHEHDERAPIAMVAAPQDDPYVLPTLMASLVLHEAGYEEVNLGPNTPLDILADVVAEEQPKFVCLAISSPLRSRHHSKDIEAIAELAASYGGVSVLGGRSVETYQGSPITVCRDMQDLSRLSREVLGPSPRSVDSVVSSPAR